MDGKPTGPLVSFQTQEALRTLGRNLRTARLRRGESQQTAAERTLVSRQTWRRLEEGAPGVAIGLLFEAMVVYGFTEQLFELADPDLDVEGAARDAARRPRHGHG